MPLPDQEASSVDVEAVSGAGQRPVRLRDGDRSVASGWVTRVVVDTAMFLREAGAGAAG